MMKLTDKDLCVYTSLLGDDPHLAADVDLTEFAKGRIYNCDPLTVKSNSCFGVAYDFTRRFPFMFYSLQYSSKRQEYIPVILSYFETWEDCSHTLRTIYKLLASDTYLYQPLEKYGGRSLEERS